MAKKETKREPLVDPYSIILHPLLTEKALGKVETENKLMFIVKRSATKKQIKWAVERALEAKVKSVNTLNDRKGRKKAIVRLTKKYPAADIAMRFGMM
jgi:ribosomal protein uL23